jgi:hypothetical protein
MPLHESVEAQIVEWADDVAYSIHDVEDWYRAGFIPLELIRPKRRDAVGHFRNQRQQSGLGMPRAQLLVILGLPRKLDVRIINRLAGHYRIGPR